MGWERVVDPGDKREAGRSVRGRNIWHKHFFLPKQLLDLKLTVDGLEKERDFYFSKLRDIELICQEHESENSPVISGIIGILYATEVSPSSPPSHRSAKTGEQASPPHLRPLGPALFLDRVWSPIPPQPGHLAHFSLLPSRRDLHPLRTTRLKNTNRKTRTSTEGSTAPALTDCGFPTSFPPPSPHYKSFPASQPASRVLCVGATALGSRASGFRRWGLVRGQGPVGSLKWHWPRGHPGPLSTPHSYLFPLSLCCVGQHSPGRCCHPQASHPPLTARSCVFDKVTGIFLLTG